MITLVMIVRNEEATIVDTLMSVGPHVHRACIVDTGSTDRTLVLAIETLLKLGISHAVHQRPWVNFSHNRNEALDFARKITEPDGWLFMLSSDARLEFARTPALDLEEGTWQAPITFEEHLPRSHAAAVQLTTLLGNWRYPQTCLFRADSDWKYRGVTHEVAMGSGPLWKPPKGVHVRYLGAGDKTARWRQDEGLLLSEIHRWGPNARPREVYYLAQTYECLEDFNMAARWYDVRAQIGGPHKAEAWEARLRCTLLLEKIAGMYGNPHWTRDDVRAALQRLTKESSRAEPWFYLAESYADEAERSDPVESPLKLVDALWDLAYLHAHIAYTITRTSPNALEFMVRRDVYEWRAKLVYAVTAYHTDRYREAREAFVALARNGSLDEATQFLIRQHIAAIDEEEKKDVSAGTRAGADAQSSPQGERDDQGDMGEPSDGGTPFHHSRRIVH